MIFSPSCTVDIILLLTLYQSDIYKYIPSYSTAY